MKKCSLVCWFLIALADMPAHAAKLKPETAAAFERYIRATEAQMADDAGHGKFLFIDRLPDLRRKEIYAQLQQGQVYIEQLHTQEDGRPIHVPNGLIHDWAGVIFIPKATLSETIALLQDYDRHQTIYKPDIRKSKLIKQNGNESEISLQFFSKSLVTVVLNADFAVSNTQFGSTEYQSAVRSTRIVEVANPGEPEEHELPVGNDHGYTWRLDIYWRVEEKNGGVYVQNESVALSRAVPLIFAWLIDPLIKSIPRNILFHLLDDTRKAVLSRESRSAEGRSPRAAVPSIISSSLSALNSSKP
jgi:hypothetical protein